MLNSIPANGFLRLKQIIGDKKTNTPALIPISSTAFLNYVKNGTYPQPVRLGVGCVAWRVEDIKQLIEKLCAL